MPGISHRQPITYKNSADVLSSLVKILKPLSLFSSSDFLDITIMHKICSSESSDDCYKKNPFYIGLIRWTAFCGFAMNI